MSVMVAALRSPRGASAELVRRIVARNVTAVASVPLYVEYEAVMTRTEHLAAAGATVADVGNVLDVLAGVLDPVEIHYLWRPWLRDSQDDMVLETAVNGRATAIVTFNLRDFEGVVEHFGIAVLEPADMLRTI